MSIKQILIILVAGIAAIAAAMLFKQISTPEVQVQSAPVQETVREVEVEVAHLKVLVASRDLEVGELITPDDMMWANWPEAGTNINQFTDEQSPEAISARWDMS